MQRPRAARCENAPIADLLDKRLVFVTGRAGSARRPSHTRSAPAAAAAGKRAIVCEIAGQDRGSAHLRRASLGFSETRARRGLWTISIDPDDATSDYLEVQLPVRSMGSLL